MPAPWPAAALNAQAVAARTYGDWQVHQPMNANYDICDTSMCQVYGGHQQYDRYGHVTTWQDLPQPASATAGQVLRYNGGPVFAQFSASNGGWTVAGSFPYLTAKQDTYDTYKPNGSPATITVAALAQQFGLKTITEIDLVRDGNGTWGGRVVSGTIVNGTTRMPITGDQFRAAVNNAVPNVPVGSTWIQLKPTP
jgi:SpoIID/LytB domain protein